MSSRLHDDVLSVVRPPLSHVGAAKKLAAEAPKPEDRMKLDRVRRHACLAVVVVEEGNAGDASLTTKADLSTSTFHRDSQRQL